MKIFIETKIEMKKSKKLHISAFIKGGKVEKSHIYIDNISLDSYSHKLHTL